MRKISIKSLNENVLVKNIGKKSAGKKYYKYFIDYLYDENKIKPLHIMLVVI